MQPFWYVIHLSVLLLIVFFGYRAHLQHQYLRQRLDLVVALLAAWAMTWGQSDAIVKLALNRALATFGPEAGQA